MTGGAAVLTPLGRIVVTERDGRIARLAWVSGRAEPPGEPLRAQSLPERGAVDGPPVLRDAVRQIVEYFAGERRDFDLPIAFEDGLTGAVQRAMCAIPFGETRTYGDLARELGACAQVIGQSCGANPVPLMVPCHRIIGATGLGGYSGRGGVETKVALLKHEGAASILI